MSEAVLVTPEISLERREVLRYLGYPRRKEPSARVAEVLAELWPRALSLVAPRGACCLVDGAAVAAAGMPDPSAQVGVGLATVGPALEQEIERLSAVGKNLESLLLDAIGSAAAESVADGVNAALCSVARGQGFRLRPRVSPGYGRWALSGQPALLGLLPAAAVGVTLNQGLMMLPRKSVSFAARLTDEEEAQTPLWRCARCELLDCAFRYDAPSSPKDSKEE